MDMKEFFDFSSEPMSSTVQANPVDINIDLLKLIKGAHQEVSFPIIFKQECGNKFRDILDTSYPSLYLISERMKKVLEETHLTGWKVFPIQLFDTKDHEITGYHGFSVTGQSGPTRYNKSEIIEKRRVPNGPLCKFYKGIFIDNWDGTDFFTPDGTYQIFITRRAADVLKKNKISNMYLENLAESENSVRSVKPSYRIS